MSDSNNDNNKREKCCSLSSSPPPPSSKRAKANPADISVLPEVEAVNELMVRDRRHFHRHPELSFKEFETAAYVVAELKKIEHVEDIRPGVGRTGVTAVIRGGAPGACVALRADMDALPIAETTGLAFASENADVMHACGHDGHMAILLGAARVLAAGREALRGSVKLLFQPAEEGYGGAREMIKDDALEGVDEVYGLHLWSYAPPGQVLVKDGPLMAASDAFDITVEGSGGHGAVPEGTKDAIVAAANLVMQLHTVVSRNVSPVDSAVVTVGQLNAGYNYNIISDRAHVRGTVRTLLPATRDTVIRRMEEVCRGVAASFDLAVRLDYQPGYPATVNDSAECVQRVRDAAAATVGAGGTVSTLPTMAAEDFSYFLQKRPGCFFFVGCSPVDLDSGEDVVPHHKSVFTIDERCLAIGASTFVRLVRSRLA